MHIFIIRTKFGHVNALQPTKVYTIISFLSPSLFLSPLSGDGVECVFDLGVECMGASGYVVILDSHPITQPKLEEKYSSDLGFFLIARIKKQVIQYLTRLTLGQLDQLELNLFIKFHFFVTYQIPMGEYNIFILCNFTCTFSIYSDDKLIIMIYRT